MRAWELRTDGSYARSSPAEGEPAVDAQRTLLDWYSRHGTGEFE